MIFQTSCAPESEREGPESVDGGAEPLVRGEGRARVSVVVIGCDGLFPVQGKVSAEELIPAKSLLCVKGVL